MKSILLLSALSIALLGNGSFAHGVEPGKPAPAFEATDSTGKVHKLSDYAGKWLVLEWFNKDCPFVKKHYGSGNMQGLQKTYTAKNVAWLTVNSSAKGKQGNLSSSDTTALMKENGSGALATLIDENGVMGKAYDAKTTPHLFVINPQGQVVYAGAIDNNSSADPKVIEGSTNYVKAALDNGLAGKKIEVASSRAYGCGVKYN